MFGIGPQELMIVALLLLVVFGPRKASNVARDLGDFVNEARRPVEEFKSELAAAEDRSEPASYVDSGKGEDGTRKPATKSKPPGKEFWSLSSCSSEPSGCRNSRGP